MTTTTTTIGESRRELAYRANDGVEVTLLWDETADTLAVCVCDAKSGDYFELESERDMALEIFYHPYAHAAFRGIEYQAGRREVEEPVCA